MKLFLTYCVLLVAVSSSAKGGFEKGNKAYENNNYETAIVAYSKVVSNGNQSADLFYNLGDAYFKNNEIGKSIWAYESALKIDPDHEDALFNLEFVNAQTLDGIDTSRHRFGHWMKSLLYSEQINFWVYTSIICSLIFAVFAFLFFRSSTKKLRNYSIFLGGLFGLLLIASVIISYLHMDSITSNTAAIIITQKTEVKMSPTNKAKISFTLSEGSKVRLIKSEKEWFQVEINGNKGWLLKNAIWEI